MFWYLARAVRDRSAKPGTAVRIRQVPPRRAAQLSGSSLFNERSHASYSLEFKGKLVKEIEEITQQEYKYGFTTDVETEVIPVGLNEDVIRLISAKKHEPEWLLEFRLKAYRKWLTMPHPNWAHLTIPEIDFQAISYYAAPKTHTGDEKKEIDPELMKTFDKLGIPLEERAALAGNMAVDA